MIDVGANKHARAKQEKVKKGGGGKIEAQRSVVLGRTCVSLPAGQFIDQIRRGGMAECRSAWECRSKRLSSVSEPESMCVCSCVPGATSCRNSSFFFVLP